MSRLKAFWRDESGVTAIEYALIAGFVSIVIFTGVAAIGTRLNTKFTSFSQGLR